MKAIPQKWHMVRVMRAFPYRKAAIRRLLCEGTLICLLAGLDHAGRAASAPPVTTNLLQPTRVALLPFQNASGDPSLDGWRDGFDEFLAHRLATAKRVDILSWSRVWEALTNANPSFKGHIDQFLATQVCRQIKADAAVWGTFTRTANRWELRLSVIHPPSTNPAARLEISSLQTSQLFIDAPLAIAQELKLQFPAGDVERWRQHQAGSDKGWDALAHAAGLSRRKAPPSEIAEMLRRTVEAEPNFLTARMLFAQMLASEDHAPEAETQCREFIRQAPDLCSGHVVLSWVLTNRTEAEAEAREALRLHAGCPSACRFLTLRLHDHHRWKELREILEKANQDLPGELSTLAFLAAARAQTGDPEGAGALLNMIGEAAEEEDFAVHLALLEGAVHSWDMQKFGREFRWMQRQAKKDPDAERKLSEIDASFVFQPANPQHLARPRCYKADELERELVKRLTPQERTLTTNPLDITPQIEALARQTTQGLTNQALRALLLFAEVAERGRGSGEGGARTAPEALRWSAQTEARFSCQEYAKLFVALARAAGLEAWMAHVEEDAMGRATYHDCAMLFLFDEAFLVDPTWRSFGAAHRRYRVLDDMQTVAHHAMQGSSPDDLPRQRVGCKMDPEDAWTRLRLVCSLADSDRTAEAAQELGRLPQEATNRWDYWYGSAAIHAACGQWRQALPELQHALGLNPSNAVVHWKLVSAYAELGQMKPSREHAEIALQLGAAQSAASFNKITSAIAFLAALEQGQSRETGSQQTLRRKAETGDPASQCALAKILFESDPPQVDEGMRWLRQAADQRYAFAQEQYALNLLRLRGKAAGADIVRYLTASAEQGNPEAQYGLGFILYEGNLVPRNLAASGQWVILASRQSHKKAIGLFKEMQLFMDPNQLAEAQRQADAFQPSHPPSGTNSPRAN